MEKDYSHSIMDINRELGDLDKAKCEISLVKINKCVFMIYPVFNESEQVDYMFECGLENSAITQIPRSE